MRTQRLVCVLALVVSANATLFASTMTWSGGASSAWSNPANWGGGVPGPADVAQFPAGIANKNVVVDVSGVSVQSLVFSGSGYSIGGNALSLSAGISNSPLEIGTNTINAALILLAPQTFGGGNGSFGRLTINGNISLGTSNLTLAMDARGLTINGSISGSGGIIGTGCCNAASVVRLTGSNSYTGPTTINGLYFEISGNQPNSDVTASSNLYGSGSWGNTNVGGTLYIGPISTTNSAILATKNFQTVHAAFDINGTTPGTGYDQIQATGTVTLVGGELFLSFGSFTPAAGDQFVLITNDGSDPVSGTFNGKAEGQTFTLNGNDFHVTYTGGDGNDVVLVCTAAAKTWTGAVDGNWSKAGNWNNGVPGPGDNVVFPDTAATKAITVDSAGVAVKSLIFAGGNFTIGGNAMSLSGGIGTTVPCCFPNTINNNLVLTAPQSIGAQSGTAGPGGRLTINGNIALGSNNLTLPMDAGGVTINGVISGTGAVTGTGCCNAASYVSLTGNNTYTGATTISGLYFEIAGNQPGSDVTTSSNMYGTGSWGNTNVGGTLYVGRFNGSGTATLATKNLQVVHTAFDINGVTAGSGYDQIQVAGSVTLGGGELMLSFGTFTPATGDQYVLIQNDGADAVSGTFNGKPEGQIFSINGNDFYVTYKGGDGNDVVLVCASAVKVWTGAVDSGWSTPGNWTGGVPGTNDNALFPDAVANKTITVAGSVAVKSLILAGGGYTIGGGTLTLSSGISTTLACCLPNTINSSLALAAPISIGDATNAGGGGRLTINGNISLGSNNLTLSAAGRGVTVNGIISGSGGISGTGCCSTSVVLTGNNLYTGPTSITGLYFEISGNQPNSDVTATSNLYGSGSWGNTIVGGTLYIGPFTGGGTAILRTKNFQLAHASFDLNGVTPGSGHDQVQTTGTLSLSGQLFTNLGFTPATGQTFVIVDNDGTDPVAGTFYGMPEGATFTVNGVTLQISYAGWTGNDVVLTAISGGANHAPSVSAVPDQTAFAGTPFTLSVASAFSDADADPLTYTAALYRGGALPAWLSFDPPSATFSGTPSSGDAGSFDVTVTATDSHGATVSDVIHMRVRLPNTPPVANAQSVTTSEGLPVAITLTGSDADGDPLSFSVTSSPSKGVLSGTPPALTYSPSPMNSGSDSFTFTVNDGLATSAPAVVSISITAIGPPAASSRPPYLVKDIDVSGSSSPTSITAMPDGRVIFSAAEPVAGREPWVSDGTTAGTTRLQDIEPGPAASSPLNFTTGNLMTFFSATTSAAGAELWKSGGTGATTVQVADINPAGSSSPASLIFWNGALFFAATDGTHGTELWSTDGTAFGTTMVADINIGGGSSSPDELTPLGSMLFFAATDANFGRELWVTDGTQGGTRMVRDIEPLGSSSPRNLSVAAGRLFFTADVNGQDELWTSDGNSSGTFRVKDINPSGGDGVGIVTPAGAFGLFTANDGVSGAELWITDGSEAGTHMVKDINPGSAGSMTAAKPVTVGSTLYFAADDGVHGVELWKSDGTAAGTMMVKDVCPGSCSSNPDQLLAAGGAVYFRATNPYVGDELWVSDGTDAGTVLSGDVEPGTGGSAPHGLRGTANLVFFSATTSANGEELHALCTTDTTHLGVTAPASVVSGAASAISVAPRDGSDRVVPCYSGTVQFTSTDTSASLPADHAFAVAEGTAQFPVTLRSLGSRRITATDAISGSITGFADVYVGASPLTSTIAAAPLTLVADGTSTSTITVQLKDAGGADLSSSIGTVVLGTTAGSLSAVTNNNNGTYTATLTAPTSTATATISGTLDGTAMAATATVTFTPGPATTAAVSAPATATGGLPFAIVVTLRDTNGNVAMGYRGTIAFTSSDGAAVLPSNYTFVAADNGAHSFDVTLNTAGTVSVTATDTVTASITANALVAVKGNTTTALQSSLNPSMTGDSVTFTATVTSPTSGTISGTVTFRDGSTVLGAPVLSGGSAGVTTSTLSQGTHSITAEYSGDADFNGSTSSALTQTVNAPLSAPQALTATATTETNVALAWLPVSGATSYEIYRSSMHAPFAPLFTTPAASANDTNVSAGLTYVYEVRAIGPFALSPFSNVDAATTIFFTDPVLANVAVKAVHITELRGAIDAMRQAAGLGPGTFTGTSLANVLVLRQHVVEMRTQLDEARAAIGLPPLAYGDPALTSGETPVKATHLEELRGGTQ